MIDSFIVKCVVSLFGKVTPLYSTVYVYTSDLRPCGFIVLDGFK